MQLTGKNIVITGGTSGIGLELVRLLHSKNTVLVLASNSHRLDSLRTNYPTIQTCCVDLSETKSLEKAVSEHRNKLRHIDLLINNAAIQNAPKFIDDDFLYSSIEAEIALNFTAPCALISLFLPELLNSENAAIMNINSGLGLAPKTSSAVYCGTKAAMNVFSQSLRYQLFETNIKVMQAFLPLVDTPMTEGRGTNKLSPKAAAAAIIKGIKKNKEDNYIGKARILRLLMRIYPPLAQAIMRSA
jgi:short-subunit dehydrogenase involved in D-alanine esterification of teichoic acids